MSKPNDVRKVNLYKSIASNNVIPVSFRMRQCETFTVPQATSTICRLGVRLVLGGCNSKITVCLCLSQLYDDAALGS